jgi:hypothetical protein
MKDDTDDERMGKIFLFWHIYTMDKALSLRLGRAPIIQDWDMSLPLPVHDSGLYSLASPMDNGLGTRMLHFWIKVAQIQGQVYEKLFSAAAFLRPAEERAQVAAQLVEALNEAWAERGDASALDFSFLPADSSDSVPRNAGTGPNVTDVPSKRNKKIFQFPTASQKSFGSTGQASLLSPEGGEFFYMAALLMHLLTFLGAFFEDVSLKHHSR